MPPFDKSLAAARIVLLTSDLSVVGATISPPAYAAAFVSLLRTTPNLILPLLAFTIFAKKMTREKRIPFDVSVDPFYAESNMTYLKKVVEDIEAGKAVLVEHELIEE